MPEVTGGSKYRALLVDYGGVLTTPLSSTLDGFCDRLGVDPADFGHAIKQLLSENDAPASVHRLETGELSVPEFEEELSKLLKTTHGGPVVATGLLTEMFAGFDREASMLDAVRSARRQGIRTGLLSNSWGVDGYPREGWDELFDAVVISGEVGLRKPQREIYQLASDLIGVPPEECVFVDDLAHNVRGAAAAGMCGVHHTDVAATLAELEVLFGLELTG